MVKRGGGIVDVWTAWLEICDILKDKILPTHDNIIRTLVNKVPNEILSVSKENIVVASLETGKSRTLPNDDFLAYLDVLARKGWLNPKEDISYSRFYKKSAIICAIIAELSYVTHNTNPLVLKLQK